MLLCVHTEAIVWPHRMFARARRHGRGWEDAPLSSQHHDPIKTFSLLHSQPPLFLLSRVRALKGGILIHQLVQQNIIPKRNVTPEKKKK